MFSALSYAELASSIPVSGSAYTYTYATLGELVAWIIGWDLILEYGVSVAGVAVGWGGNLNEFLREHVQLRAARSRSPNSPENGGIINLPAVFDRRRGHVPARARRARDARGPTSSWSASSSLILAFFIVVAFVAAFSSDHLTPFAPHGTHGVVSAAAVIFFAYIGFDAVSTGAEEAREPKRDLPLAIIGSLVHLHGHLHPGRRSPPSGSLDAKSLAASTRRWPRRSTRAPGSAGRRGCSRSARWWRSRACC